MQDLRVSYSHLGFPVSVVLGFLPWLLSPILTGQKEAWLSWEYYIVSLTVAGFIPAAIEPRRFWLMPFGVLLGQVVYFGMSGEFAVMVLLMLAYPLLFTVAGAVVGAGVGMLARRLWP